MKYILRCNAEGPCSVTKDNLSPLQCPFVKSGIIISASYFCIISFSCYCYSLCLMRRHTEMVLLFRDKTAHEFESHCTCHLNYKIILHCINLVMASRKYVCLDKLHYYICTYWKQQTISNYSYQLFQLWFFTS